MSRTIDTRIVEMQFDNAAFEKGVAATTRSLENLDKTIEKASGSQSIGKLAESFSGLTAKLTNLIPSKAISLASSKVASAVGSIFVNASKKLSLVSKIGLGAIGSMGAAVTALAATGGMTRALNIEQAQFQLKGLGVAWEDIYDDIDYAVSGTAYGLDEAAKAASQLVASNVQVGDSMKTALRGISGVAAMTNSTYDDIAHVFTRVAGQGVAMSNDFDSLAARGLNARASMAKFLNEVNSGSRDVSDHIRDMVRDITKGIDVSEADIRDFTKDKLIDFELFAEAMDSAYGEHAKAANETFKGSMANVKAALSRVGELFSTPFIHNMTDVFNSIRPFIDVFKRGLAPVVNDYVTPAFERAKDAITGFFKVFTDTGNEVWQDNALTGEFEKLRVSSAQRMEWNIWAFLNDGAQIVKHFGDVWKDVFGSDTSLNTFAIVDSITEMAEAFFHFKNYLLDEAFTGRLKSVFESIKAVVDAVGKGIGDLWNTITGNMDSSKVESVVFGLLDIFSKFNNVIAAVTEVFFRFLNNGLEVAMPIIEDILNVIGAVGESIWSVLAPDGDTELHLQGVLNLLDSGKETLLNWYHSVEQSLPTLEDFKSFLSDLITKIQDFLKIPDDFRNGGLIGNIVGLFSVAASAIGNFMSTVGGYLSDSGFFSAVRDFFSGFNFLDVLNTLLAALGTKELIGFVSTFRDFVSFFTSDGKGILDIANNIGAAVDSIKDAFADMQASLRVKQLLWIAAAIGLIALSCSILASIPPTELATAGAVVGILMAILRAMATSISEELANAFSGSKVKAIASVVAVLMSIAGAIFVIALAIKIMSSIDSEDIPSVVTGMVAAVLALVSLASVLSLLQTKSGQVLSGSATIFAIAMAFLPIAAAAKILSTIKTDQMDQAFGGLLLITIALGALAAEISLLQRYSKGVLSGAAVFATIGLAFISLAGAVKILSTIGPDQLKGATIAMSVMTLMLGAVILLSGFPSWSSLLASAAAMVTLSVLLVSATASLAVLSALGASAFMGVVALAATLAVLAGAMFLFGLDKVYEGVPGILLASVALITLSGALAILAAIPSDRALQAVVAVAGTLAVLGVAAALIPSEKLLGLAAALSVLAFGAIQLSIAFAIVSAAVLVLAMAFKAIIDTIQSIVSPIGELFASIGAAVGDGLTALITSFSKGVADNSKSIRRSTVTIGREMAGGLKDVAPDVADAGAASILAFVKGIADNAGRLGEQGLNIVTNLIIGIAAGIGPLVDAAVQLVIMFILGIADAFRNNQRMLANAINSVMLTIGQAVLYGLASIVEGIPGFGKSMADGIRASAGEMKAAADEASSAVHKEFDEKNAATLAGTKTTLSDIKKAIGDFAPKLGAEGEGAGESASSGFLGKITDIVPGTSTTFADVMSTMSSKGIDLSKVMDKDGNISKEAFLDALDSMPEDTETIAQSAADKADGVDYETPGKNNAEEYADGIDKNAWMSEGEAESMSRNAAAASDEYSGWSWGSGSNLSSNFASGIDPYAGDDPAYRMGYNAWSNIDATGGQSTYSTGYNLGKGLINGLEAIWSTVMDLSYNFGAETVDYMNMGAGESSPSKLTKQTGRYLGEGVIIGLKQIASDVYSASEDVGRGAALAMNGFGSLVDQIDWDANPTITPVLDTSLVEQGIGAMNGLFTSSQVRQAGWAAGNYSLSLGSGSSQSKSANNNSIVVNLNYDAGADANDLVRGIARALRTSAIMEG